MHAEQALEKSWCQKADKEVSAWKALFKKVRVYKPMSLNG